jgi:hypothetical protein
MFYLWMGTSYDEDDYIDTFNWTQTYGPAVSFLDYTAEPVLQLPYVSDSEIVQISLTVTDLSGADSTVNDIQKFIIVNPDFEHDKIDAGDDVVVFSGQSVELNADVLVSEVCDPLSNCTYYGNGLTWYQLNGPALVNTNDTGDTFTFEAPQVNERTKITLALADVYNEGPWGLVPRAVDPINIEVLPVTQGLTAIAGEDQQASENTQIVLDGSANQAEDGVIAAYRWEQIQGPEALIVSPDEATTQVFLPPLPSAVSKLTFVLTVVDETGLEAYDIVEIDVTTNLDDGDYDADGVADEVDSFPYNSKEAYDIDGDGRGDNTDVDRDGDGAINSSDFYPNDSEHRRAPEITITEPLDGATINSDYVIVKGTVSTDTNVGITVNGVVAERINGPNGSEFAARIPLLEGDNLIRVLATTLASSVSGLSISVSREGSDPVDFYVSERNCMAPHINTLSFGVSLGVTISQLEIDFEGDGVYDEVITSGFMDDIFYQYDVAGIFYPKARFTLSTGEQYTVTQVVNVESQEQIDQHLSELWDNMNLALTQGNHGLAVEYLSEENREKYAKLYYLLLPYFSEIVQSYSPLQVYKIYPGYASYIVNRDIAGTDHAFIVSFFRGSEGLWRVLNM